MIDYVMLVVDVLCFIVVLLDCSVWIVDVVCVVGVGIIEFIR